MNELEKIMAIMEYLDIPMQNPRDSFRMRFIIQKIAYISSSIGIQLPYSFNLYYHGPYSPRLAQAYYNSSPMQKCVLDTIDKGKVKKIKEYLIHHPLYNQHSDLFLEACATLLFLKDHTTTKLSDIQLIQQTKKQKPHISEKIILIVLNIIKQMEFSNKDKSTDIQKEISLWDSAQD